MAERGLTGSQVVTLGAGPGLTMLCRVTSKGATGLPTPNGLWQASELPFLQASVEGHGESWATRSQLPGSEPVSNRPLDGCQQQKRNALSGIHEDEGIRRCEILVSRRSLQRKPPCACGHPSRQGVHPNPPDQGFVLAQRRTGPQQDLDAI